MTGIGSYVTEVNILNNSLKLNISVKSFIYDDKNILHLEMFETSDITFVLNKLSIGTMGNLNTYGAYFRFYAYTNCSPQNSSKLTVQTNNIATNISY